MPRKDHFESGGPDSDAPTSLVRDVDRLVHKLRTPLNSLSLNADLIATVSQPKPGKEALYQRAIKSLQTEVGRLDTIAGDFQDYVAASVPTLSEVPLGELVKTAAQDAQGEDGGKANGGAAKVETDIATPSTKIGGDARLLSSAIAELIANAFEAAPGAPVKVRARISGGDLQVDVEDAGGGFDFDPPDRAFELFMGSKQGHLGFGLTYARRIARLHGGDVTIVRSTKQGTVLRFAVPARAGAPADQSISTKT